MRPPFGGDVSQRQPDQLAGRVVAGEVPTRLDDLAQSRVDTLDRVVRVDHPAHFGREGEERNHMALGTRQYRPRNGRSRVAGVAVPALEPRDRAG